LPFERISSSAQRWIGVTRAQYASRAVGSYRPDCICRSDLAAYDEITAVGERGVEAAKSLSIAEVATRRTMRLVRRKIENSQFAHPTSGVSVLRRSWTWLTNQLRTALPKPCVILLPKRRSCDARRSDSMMNEGDLNLHHEIDS